MENLYSFVKGSGFLVILCTENGFLIKVIGDDEPLGNARSIDFIEGADWSGESMGTNAIGTCLIVNRPVQIYGAEHFTQVCRSWTCSAAPIHDPAIGLK
jgi:sigma-54 dependent transcriptional regulator, acetoin dehydrogenase operon transcriptional activator AcoR